MVLTVLYVPCMCEGAHVTAVRKTEEIALDEIRAVLRPSSLLLASLKLSDTKVYEP